MLEELSLAFLHYWPTLLALISRAAPARVNAAMMGFAFMSLFIFNSLSGWLGSFYERMSSLAFWTLHVAISALGGILVYCSGIG